MVSLLSSWIGVWIWYLTRDASRKFWHIWLHQRISLYTATLHTLINLALRFWWNFQRRCLAQYGGIRWLPAVNTVLAFALKTLFSSRFRSLLSNLACLFLIRFKRAIFFIWLFYSFYYQLWRFALYLLFRHRLSNFIFSEDKRRYCSIWSLELFESIVRLYVRLRRDWGELINHRLVTCQIGPYRVKLPVEEAWVCERPLGQLLVLCLFLASFFLCSLWSH